MKQRLPQRVISLLMVLVLMVSYVPPVYAAENVAEVVEASVSIKEPVETSLTVGQTVQLEAVVEPEQEGVVLTWSSSDENVASVSEDGLVTALAAGTVVIEAAAADITDSLELTVVAEQTEEATEATETEAPTEETQPEETAEETQPEETTEATEPEETTEETEPEELPYGLAGLPEDYVLSEEALTEKQEIAEYHVLEDLASMVPGEDYVENQIMVTAASEEDALVIAEAFSGELKEYFTGTAVITLDTVTVAQAVEASADMDAHLPAAYPDYLIKVDPIISTMDPATMVAAPVEQTWESWVQENMTNPDPALMNPDGYSYQYMHDVVDTYAAWGITTGESWVKVAVIDTGVMVNHPDLGGRVTHYDVGAGTGDPDGHGTHVAGIIGASMDNGIGGAGIAPGVSIMAYRTANDSGSLVTSYITSAIRDAADRGAHIINMSLGGYGYNASFRNAVTYAVNRGVTVVVAMGNDGTNVINFPAYYDGVIAVGSTDQTGRRANYSTYGPWADVSAPGTDIYSTYNDGSHCYLSGTSMASPVVAGVAALYMSAKGYRVSPSDMEKALEKNATKCPDSGMGAGIVNIANMLDGKPAVPEYYLKVNGSTSYDYDSGDTVPCESKVFFYTYGDNDMGAVLYTINGKTPSIKNGQVVNGEYYNGSVGIDLSSYAGSTVTIKAVCISGMGIAGKVRTLKLKVAKTTNVTGITITGPKTLIAGKSGEFSAVVAPADLGDQRVNWSIVSSAIPGAKIDSKGKLTTPKGYSGSITVRATSAVKSSVYQNFAVSVQAISPVSKMSLNASKASVFVGQSYNLSIAKMVDAKGNPVNPGVSGVKWTSSNTKVATVDSNGKVTALAKGTATITCKALDGSGKSAKCKVTVKQQVTDLEITGNLTIAPGFSGTYKAIAYPTNANTKTVTWSVDSGNATISSKGVVKIPTGAPVNSYVTIRATAKDGCGASATFTLKIVPKCTSIYAKAGTYYGYAAGAKTNNSGHVTTVNLFSVDLPDNGYDTYYQDNVFQLVGYATNSGNYTTYAAWSSSNPSVAEVDENGKITAHKAGTAKIYLTALDGSKKKATITVKVTNPVSSISIQSSAVKNSSGYYDSNDMRGNANFLAFGKSATNKAVFADSYGKPGNTGVNWSFAVRERKNDGTLVRTLTSTFRNNKLVTLSSSGKLSVKSGVANYLSYSGGYFEISVTATAKDGTGASATINYLAIPATKTLKVYRLENLGGGVISVRFYTEQNRYGYQGYWQTPFVTTTSNPKLFGAGYMGKYGTVRVNGVLYNSFEVQVIYPGLNYTGKVKIYLKSADGTGKSSYGTITVS